MEKVKTPKDFDLAGRGAIIPGAARGVGKGIVRVFAESGATWAW